MFDEPTDTILAVVGGVWLLGSISVAPVLYSRRIGQPRVFRDAVDTGAVWVNRVTFGVVWVLLAIYYTDRLYEWFGWWGVSAAVVCLCLILLAPLGAKMQHKQESDTDAAGDLDTAPGVGDSPPNSPA